MYFYSRINFINDFFSIVYCYIVYLKVGRYQWSVLSPLLFAVVVDGVPIEARSGIPSELLYAVDLDLTAPIIELLDIHTCS